MHSGSRIYLRVHGEMVVLSSRMSTESEVWEFCEQCMTPELKSRWFREKSLDFGIKCGERYRANFYFESRCPAVVLRRVGTAAPTFEKIGMPSCIRTILAAPHGLILLTGATGCGKSTSLAAMVNHVLSTRAVHVLTIEDPIEFRFRSQRSLISQREVGVDAPCFASALRAAFREDPDVILIGEMRDLETISLALTAAEAGHLVLATLHTSSCAGAVSRIVDAFPADSREQARVQLAGSLRMVVNQRLLPRIDQSGRVAAFEVLLANDAVHNLVRENKIHQLPGVIETARAQGMVSIRSSLMSLRAAGVIDNKWVEDSAPGSREGAVV